MHVPIDDEHTMFWHVRANVERPYTEDEERVHRHAAGLVPGVGIDENLNRTASRENRWLQDRDEMRFGDRLSGMQGRSTRTTRCRSRWGRSTTARTSTSARPTRP